MSSSTPFAGGPPDTSKHEGPGAGDDVYTTVQDSDGFRGLRRSFRSFAFPVTAAFCSWYLLYVLLAVYAKDFMGTDVVGDINIGFVFGILQFVTTFLIAWWYARYARTRLDPVAEQLRASVEERIAGDAR